MQRTPHFLLRLFESADKPTWLEDWNDTMLQLDAALFNLAGGGDTPSIAEIVSRIDALTLSVNGLEDDVTDIQSTITQIQSILTDLSTTVSSHTSEIADISSSLAGLSSQLSSLDDRVTALEQGGGGQYVLPVASANTLGGVKIGQNLHIDQNGVLSSDKGGVKLLKYFPNSFYPSLETSVALTQDDIAAMAWKAVLITAEILVDQYFDANDVEVDVYESTSATFYCRNSDSAIRINKALFQYSGQYDDDNLGQMYTGLWEVSLDADAPYIKLKGTYKPSTNPEFQNVRIYILEDVVNGSGGVTSYNDLTDKPQVNTNVLSGNKTTADLGITDGLTGTYSGEVLTLTR